MDKQPPPLEPTNVQRALWAKVALAVFTAATYSGDHPDTMHRDDLETAICDLICDLLHFARLHPRMDAAEIHAHALRLFEQEIADEEFCADADRGGQGSCRDTQRTGARQATVRDGVGSGDLLDALDALTGSLSPRKIAPVLKAAGYSTDAWLAAHRNACRLISQAKRRKGIFLRIIKTGDGSRRAILRIDNRFQIEIQRHAPPPMASAQIVLDVYPITDGEAWEEPYAVFAVDEGRIIELETQAWE
jgi:hypothetical protein